MLSIPQYLDSLKKKMRESYKNSYPNLPEVGVSGSWDGGHESTIADMVTTASDSVDNSGNIIPDKTSQAPETPAPAAAAASALVADNPAMKAAEEEKQRVASMQYAKKPETSKIDPVSDRYQATYDKSQDALNAYNKKYFSNGVNGNVSSGDLSKYNSPERAALIRNNKQAFRLLQGGSFADNANIQAEERQKNAAQAQSALSDVAYKQNLGHAAVDTAKISADEELRKQHESAVAEAYLKMGAPKKTKKIDLNDIHSMFLQ